MAYLTPLHGDTTLLRQRTEIYCVTAQNFLVQDFIRKRNLTNANEFRLFNFAPLYGSVRIPLLLFNRSNNLFLFRLGIITYLLPNYSKRYLVSRNCNYKLKFSKLCTQIGRSGKIS